MKTKESTTLRKLTLTFISIFIIICTTIVTTFALVHEKLVLDENIFTTGTIDINLNDGKAVIDNDMFIEPGMTLIKEFFLENEGTDDAYYKLYFKNIKGSLSEVLDIEIKEGEEVVYQGKIKDLTLEYVKPADDILKAGEKIDFELTIHFPEESSNVHQGAKLSFDLSADATQVKNNDNKEF